MSTIVKENQTTKAFQLKGSLFTLTVLQLLSVDLKHLDQRLAETISQTPLFFQNAPIVIDISLLSPKENINLAKTNNLLRQHGMIPVGVRGANELQQEKARAAGLAILTTSISEKKPSPQTPKKASKEKVAKTTPSYLPTKTITQPVRSGQQIYAPKSDLIILNSVSTGAEVLADGNIHVYGPLRGRALAGVTGNTTAHIFCQSIEAELISIAGRYLVSENLTYPKDEGYTHIYLEGEQLQITTV